MSSSFIRDLLAIPVLVVGLCLWHGSALAEEEVADEPAFIEFAPVSVSVVHNNRVAGFLSIAFGVMVDDPGGYARVEALLPKISAANVQMLARIARTRLDVTKAVNLELLRAYLQRTVDQVVGKGIAQVLIQDATLQPR